MFSLISFIPSYILYNETVIKGIKMIIKISYFTKFRKILITFHDINERQYEEHMLLNLIDKCFKF